MKKSVLFIVSFLVLSVSCKNHLNLGSDSLKTVDKTAKIQRYTVDKGQYVDVTMKNVDAKLFDVSYFNEMTSFGYKSKNAVIYFDKTKGTVNISVFKSENNSFKGKKMECTFEYDVKAASSNCIYICPKTRNGNVCYIDGEAFSFVNLPSYMFYIPLYGFGENRIEISSVMKNEGILSCQTFWAY